MKPPLMMTGYNMATRKQLKDYAISRKILILMREGFPQKQATAIAFRMYRDGELNIPTPAPKVKKPNPIRERNERRRRYAAELRKRRGY